MIKTIFGLILIFTSMALEHRQASASLPQQAPEDIQELFKTQGLNKKYDFPSHLKPPYLRSDFTGDGKPDCAVLVRDRKTDKIGIAICNFANKTVSILGAGGNFGNGGDNFDWMDVWSITPKAKLRRPVAALAKGDALFVEKSESASALIYWNGAKYVWRQQGD